MGFSPCSYLEHILFIRSVPGFPASPLSPATTYVVLPKENHMHSTEAATLDRKSGEAEGSAVPRTFRGSVDSPRHTELSSGPKRTRISCHAALDKTVRAPFLKERRMMFANATNIHRKSGVAQWSDLRFSSRSHANTLSPEVRFLNNFPDLSHEYGALK